METKHLVIIVVALAEDDGADVVGDADLGEAGQVEGPGVPGAEGLQVVGHLLLHLLRQHVAAHAQLAQDLQGGAPLGLPPLARAVRDACMGIARVG